MLDLKNLLILFIGVSGVFGKNPVSFTNAPMTTVVTRDDLNYRPAVLSVGGWDTFVFRVQACNNAHLYLQGQVGERIMVMEVIIGGWENKRSGIRLGVGTANEILTMIRDTPNILNCHEMRTFWLSWQQERLWVGKGAVFDQQTFLNLNRTRFGYIHPVTALTFANGFRSQGVWQFPENQGESLILETPPVYSYNTLWKSVENRRAVIFFEVRACSSVHVALSETQGVFKRRAYEVVIGGWNNTRSVIRRFIQGQAPRVILDRAGILSCGYTRAFWVAWRNNTLRVGEGYVYNERALMAWPIPADNRIDIGGIGFSTFFSTEGLWRFPENMESAFVFRTRRDAYFNKVYIETPRLVFIRFYVKACHSAVLYISPEETPLRENVLEIGMGFNNNQDYYIKADGEIQAQGQAFDVLRCDNFVYFWLLWAGGLIRVGTDHIVGNNAYVTWQSPYVITSSVGFRSAETEAEWRVRANFVDNTRIETDNAYGRQHTMIWVDQELMKVFSIRGCSGATMSLLNSHAWDTRWSVEITIGAENNQKTLIKESVSGNVRAEADTPYILSCSEHRTFWVSWFDFDVRIGRGWRYGQNTIVNATLPIGARYQIEALRLSAEQDVTRWSFPGDAGDVVQRTTPGVFEKIQWMIPHSTKQWLILNVQACSSVLVLLSAEYSLDPKRVYEIGLSWDPDNRSFIKKDSVTQAEVVGADTGLSCTDPRTFYVSWIDGNIEVGRGIVPDRNLIIQWKDTETRRIQSVGVTSGSDQQAEWQFASNDLQESVATLEPRTEFNSYWAGVKHRQSIVLMVRSCKAFRVSLGTIMGYNSTRYSYTIEIGGGADGMYSTIRTGDRQHAYSPSPYILHCEEDRPVWISWTDGVILVGKGERVGNKIFMTFHDTDPIVVQAIGFSNMDYNPARVRMLHDEVKFAELKEESPYQSSSVSGGQMAGLIIGVLLVLALAGGAIYVIFRPPDRLRKILYPDVISAPAVSARDVGFNSQLGREQQPS